MVGALILSACGDSGVGDYQSVEQNQMAVTIDRLQKAKQAGDDYKTRTEIEQAGGDIQAQSGQTESDIGQDGFEGPKSDSLADSAKD